MKKMKNILGQRLAVIGEPTPEASVGKIPTLMSMSETPIRKIHIEGGSIMNNTKRTIYLSARIQEMPEKTKIQRERKANALRHFENRDRDPGALGRVEEILSQSKGSRAVNFAKQGKADCFVWVDGKRYNAERKTNGGRVESLYSKKAPKFVVYSMDICNKGTSNLRRVIQPVVMKTALFLEILESCGALKSTNGNNPEIAIQVTSKKFFLAMSEYTLTYDPNNRYTSEDF
jgi:hypothetical protein